VLLNKKADRSLLHSPLELLFVEG